MTQYPNPLKNATWSIANGAALSTAIELEGYGTPVGLTFPTAWTAAVVTFQWSPDGTTYYELRDNLGSAVVVQDNESTLENEGADLDPGIFGKCAYIKVRSGSSGAPVNQGAARTGSVVCRPFTSLPSGRVATAAGTVAVTSVIPGTDATNLGKAEDNAHATGDVGVMALGVRKDTAAATGADGDYMPPIFDSTGRQHVTPEATVADGADVALGAVADAAVSTDANGTANAHLRGVVVNQVEQLSRTPAALAAGGGLKVEGVAGGVAVPVQGHGFSIPVTLTVTNGVYTAKDVVGGLQTLAAAVSANGKHAMIYDVSLAGVTAIECDIWFLSGDIATPAADNAAFTLVAADQLLDRGVVSIYASDWHSAASSFATAHLQNVGLLVRAGAATTSLYFYVVHNGTTSPGTTTMYARVSGEWVD